MGGTGPLKCVRLWADPLVLARSAARSFWNPLQQLINVTTDHLVYIKLTSCIFATLIKDFCPAQRSPPSKKHSSQNAGEQRCCVTRLAPFTSFCLITSLTAFITRHNCCYASNHSLIHLVSARSHVQQPCTPVLNPPGHSRIEDRPQQSAVKLSSQLLAVTSTTTTMAPTKEIVSALGDAALSDFVELGSSQRLWIVLSVSLMLLVVFGGPRLPLLLLSTLDSNMKEGQRVMKQLSEKPFPIFKADEKCESRWQSHINDMEVLHRNAKALYGEALRMELEGFWVVLIGFAGLSVRIWQCQRKVRKFEVRIKIFAYENEDIL